MSTGVWQDVTGTDLKAGDVLRVKHEAYASNAGKLHNGRLVKVINVEDGDVHVTTIDMKLPFIARARHAAYRLERKVVSAQ